MSGASYQGLVSCLPSRCPAMSWTISLIQPNVCLTRHLLLHAGCTQHSPAFTGSITHSPRQNRAMHSCLHLIWRARQAGALALAALPGQPTPLTSTAPIAYYKHQKQICTSHFSKQGEESTLTSKPCTYVGGACKPPNSPRDPLRGHHTTLPLPRVTRSQVSEGWPRRAAPQSHFNIRIAGMSHPRAHARHRPNHWIATVRTPPQKSRQLPHTATTPKRPPPGGT